MENSIVVDGGNVYVWSSQTSRRAEKQHRECFECVNETKFGVV